MMQTENESFFRTGYLGIARSNSQMSNKSSLRIIVMHFNKI